MQSHAQLIQDINNNNFESVSISNQIATGLNPLTTSDDQQFAGRFYGRDCHLLPNNQLLLISVNYNNIDFLIWDINTKQLLKNSRITFNHNVQYTKSLIHNKFLILGDNEGYISLINVETLTLLNSKKIHNGAVQCLYTDDAAFLSTSVDAKIHKLVAPEKPDEFFDKYYHYYRFNHGMMALKEWVHSMIADKNREIFTLDGKGILKRWRIECDEKFDEIIPGHFLQMFGKITYTRPNYPIQGEYLLCSTDKNNLMILGDGYYMYDSSRFAHHEIQFKDEQILAANHLNNEFIFVKTTKNLYICNFITGEKLGKINLANYYSQGSNSVFLGKHLIMRHDVYKLGRLSFHHLTEETELINTFTAVKTSKSIKKFSLIDKQLNMVTLNSLSDLVEARPDIQYNFSPEVQLQLDIKHSQLQYLHDSQYWKELAEKNKQALQEYKQKIVELKLDLEKAIAVKDNDIISLNEANHNLQQQLSEVKKTLSMLQAEKERQDGLIIDYTAKIADLNKSLEETKEKSAKYNAINYTLIREINRLREKLSTKQDHSENKNLKLF